MDSYDLFFYALFFCLVFLLIFFFFSFSRSVLFASCVLVLFVFFRDFRFFFRSRGHEGLKKAALPLVAPLFSIPLNAIVHFRPHHPRLEDIAIIQYLNPNNLYVLLIQEENCHIKRPQSASSGAPPTAGKERNTTTRSDRKHNAKITARPRRRCIVIVSNSAAIMAKSDV